MMTSKLAHYRRKTGLSQEQLAAVSGVSARTIQRIESGRVEAHPATLKMLADALKVQTEELTVDEKLPSFIETKNEDKTKPLFHMFALIGLCFPVFNIILPALFWFFKKDESVVYDLEGKSVVNFQITMSILLVSSVILMIFIFPVGFPLVVVVYFYTFFMSVVNVFKSLNKRTTYYPLTFLFLK
ncbi:helix-turn-helix domain-containing protein [Chryseobacterium paludis]|uniref:helix-turn-helix domain-containing protein n=1 Tax=Chryseobacterium paludis TaxID=2956784 RepID=UPI0021BE072D|nr:helix-turn-helix domain-containing protein [Chryseobacterium paludis]